jgi:hypothetical protein
MNRVHTVLLGTLTVITVACSSSSTPSLRPGATQAASNRPTALPAAAPRSSEASVSCYPSERQTITSPMHGWTADLPVSWRLRAATEAWPPHTYPVAGALYTDNMEPPVACGWYPAFDVNVQQRPADQTSAEFLEFMTIENETHGYEVVDEDEIVIDGVTGRLQRQKSNHDTGWEVILFSDQNTYTIYWVDLQSQIDRNAPLFQEIMGSFRFPGT